MVTYLLSKRLVNPSTYHKDKCLLFFACSSGLMPKLPSQRADFMFCELVVDSVWSMPFLCGGVSLSNSQRNILFTK